MYFYRKKYCLFFQSCLFFLLQINFLKYTFWLCISFWLGFQRKKKLRVIIYDFLFHFCGFYQYEKNNIIDEFLFYFNGFFSFHFEIYVFLDYLCTFSKLLFVE